MEFVEYFRTLGPLQLAGVVGFITYLSAFAAVQCGWMDGNSLAFTLCNMLAAALVGVSLVAELNLSSALIQASYLIIGTVGIFRWARARSATAPAANWGAPS
jgi:hypothetical protein